MSDREYTPNSHKYKEEQKEKTAEKRVEKVITGTATTKKKSEVSKFVGKIFSVEDMNGIKEHIVDEVVAPCIRNTIYDLIVDIASRAFGGRGRRGGSGGGYGGSRVSYAQCYTSRNDSRPVGGGSSAPTPRSRFDFDVISFPSRADAEVVLDQMNDCIARYGHVTVADMYDMAGLTQPYTSDKYGWMSLRGADIMWSTDGFIIKLPKASPID